MGGVCAKSDIRVGVFGYRVTNLTSQNGGYCETPRLGHQAEYHAEMQLSQQPQNIRVFLFTALLRQRALGCHGYHEN